ncbi:MAG: EamA family transporter, partial [Spirochaetaceae bacterium]|nr:EamA family transporter [Spirochaetaceae bacterium]
MTTAKKGYGAELLLTLTAVIWGFAFVAQRVGMDHVGPFAYNGVRFALGALSLLPLWVFLRRRPASAPEATAATTAAAADPAAAAPAATTAATAKPLGPL